MFSQTLTLNPKNVHFTNKIINKINRIKLKKTKAIVDCWNTINNLKRSFIYSQLGMNN